MSVLCPHFSLKSIAYFKNNSIHDLSYLYRKEGLLKYGKNIYGILSHWSSEILLVTVNYCCMSLGKALKHFIQAEKETTDQRNNSIKIQLCLPMSLFGFLTGAQVSINSMSSKARSGMDDALNSDITRFP